MKNNENDIIKALAYATIALAIFLAAILLQSCKTTCVPERVEIHDTIVKTDSVVVHHTRDSIVYKDKQDSTYEYARDSVSEKQRNDTIFVTNWKVRYKYVYKSLSNNQSTTTTDADKQLHQAKQSTQENEVIVKTERYVPAFFKFCAWWFFFSVLAIVFAIVWWIADYIPALKPIKTWLKLIFKFK